MKALVYDLEILNAIKNKDEEFLPDIKYCGGWNDHANMGISVLTAYDCAKDEVRVFCGDNLPEFLDLVEECDYVVGFNSHRFDRRVVNAVLGCEATHGHHFFDKNYDILAEMWVSSGLDPDKFYWKTHGGFSLDDTCAINGLPPKRLNGALAPIMWQRGYVGKVIDYCIDDTLKTKKLLDIICRDGALNNPKVPGTILPMRRPWLGGM